MTEDSTETNNLSDEYPEKVKEFEWNELAHELDVFPSPTPINK